MKFSLRYFLSILIFIGILALVSVQVLSNNQNIPLAKKIISTLNPFWRIENVHNTKQFLQEFTIPVENSLDTPIFIHGKITIEQDGKLLQNIGIEWADETSSWHLVDYLNINPENHSIPAKSAEVFSVTWHGFGDQFLEDGKPTITFTSPSELYQNASDFDTDFWQKVVIRNNLMPIVVNTEITTLDENNNILKTSTDKKNIIISYPLYTKTTNTGLIIIFWFVSAMILILTKMLSSRHEKDREIAMQKHFEDMQNFAKQISENKKTTFKKISSKTLKKSKK